MANISVDFVFRGSGLDIAQACHWFDWSKVWPEMERVLRVGGTAAFWVRSLSYLSFCSVIHVYFRYTLNLDYHNIHP